MKYGIEEDDWGKICRVFSDFVNIKKAVLFGSRAKGTNKPFSDVDIALIGDKLTISDLLRLHTEIDDLLLPFEFDFLIYGNITNNELRNHIDRRGQVVYEKDAIE